MTDRARRDRADLHCHTTCSDGGLTPAELVAAARAAGLETIAITDHDTLAGIPPARAAAGSAQAALEVVAGVELSCRAGGRELHLLGLYVDVECAALHALTDANRRARETRVEQLIERARRLRLGLTREQVERHAEGAPIGRPHVAAALVGAGVVGDAQEAFARFLGVGRPLYVPRPLPAVIDAIAAVPMLMITELRTPASSTGRMRRARRS